MKRLTHLSEPAPFNAPDSASRPACAFPLLIGLNSALGAVTGRLDRLNSKPSQPRVDPPVDLIRLLACAIKVARNYFTQ
jgi:hypothetical protein